MTASARFRVIPIYPAPERLAIRVIVSAMRGSDAPQRTLPGLTLNGSDGRPSDAGRDDLAGWRPIAARLAVGG